MIYYGKLLELFEKNNITSYTIKNEKLIGQETLRKIKSGTGIYEEGYDTNNKQPDGKSTKKIRVTAIDTKAIEALCKRLQCQPNDIMEVIPNTWENADRLCEILKCGRSELSEKVPMENDY
jgi:hypothetical protein